MFKATTNSGLCCLKCLHHGQGPALSLDLPCVCVCAGQNVVQLLPPNANCVRLLAAGRFNHSRTLWQAVLVEPVVKPLKASLSVQQIAQVTSDIADAMEQLAELDCTSGHLAKQRQLPGGHGCHGWLYDLVLQRWVWDGPDLGHYVVSPEDLLCTDLQTYEAGTYVESWPDTHPLQARSGSSRAPPCTWPLMC